MRPNSGLEQVFGMEGSARLLKYRNLQRLVNELETIYEPVGEDRLAAHFADVLKRLIPGDFYGVSVVIPNGRRNHRDARLFPTPNAWPTLAGVFADLYSKFPLRSIRESGDLHSPIALSDVSSRAKIEHLDLYHHYYRTLGVADDLSINFGDLTHRVCLAILRGRRGFSDQDRAILAILRPHMERAYRYNRLLEFARHGPARLKAGSQLPGLERNFESTSDNSPEALRVLGLTEREAEVLYWVTAGKSSPVISTILGIRHDTVRTHLKRVFTKLGVENRWSAALRALQILGTVPSV
jgi:DNA-binding CsgD family transcriptional regulator